MRKYLVELYLLMFPTATPPSNMELTIGLASIFGIVILAYLLLN